MAPDKIDSESRKILIKNVKVLDTQSNYHNSIVDVVIENGIITDIGTGLIADVNVTIVEGDELMTSTGWVDVFADYSEPGYEHKETIATGLAGAAAGGFTDVLLAPNTQPAISGKSVIQYVAAASAGNIVSLHPLGAATQNLEGKTLAEMMDMRTAGAVAFTDGWKPLQHSGLVLKVLEYIKAFHGVFIQIPDDTGLSVGGLMHEGIVSTSLGMPGIPAIAETVLLHRDLELLRYTDSRLHVTGLSSAESVAMIRTAKAGGLKITCSVTPYHLLLTDESLKGYDSNYKVSPPLRTEADRLALIEGLADGTIDCIATHHHPQDWDGKTKEFEYAAPGIAIQQIAFPLLCMALQEYVTADRLAELLSTVPRDIFGLPHVTVTVGAKACLTIFSTAGKFVVNRADMRSVAFNNPFTDRELNGRVIGVVNNNQLYLNKK